MIILHVLLAVASLILSTFNLVSPSAKKSTISYGLATSTLASGVLLIFINNASVLRTCLTGVIFFVVITVMNQVASRKLAVQMQ
jgi:hypothetical protein